MPSLEAGVLGLLSSPQAASCMAGVVVGVVDGGVVSAGPLLWAGSGKGTDKTHLLASATLQRKFGRSMRLDKHD